MDSIVKKLSKCLYMIRLLKQSIADMKTWIIVHNNIQVCLSGVAF